MMDFYKWLESSVPETVDLGDGGGDGTTYWGAQNRRGYRSRTKPKKGEKKMDLGELG